MSEKFSTKKTILIILVAFVLYLVGALLSSVCMELVSKVVTFENKYVFTTIRHISDFAFVFLLLWLCIYKIFRLKFQQKFKGKKQVANMKDMYKKKDFTENVQETFMLAM